MDIKFITLDSGSDAALFVNDQFVASVDTSFDEDGSIDNLSAIAGQLSEATGFPLQRIEALPLPTDEDWTWAGIFHDLISTISQP